MGECLIICVSRLVIVFSVVTKPPFEVTETGWGEFEIAIKIYFHDPNERPVSTLYSAHIFI